MIGRGTCSSVFGINVLEKKSMSKTSEEEETVVRNVAYTVYGGTVFSVYNKFTTLKCSLWYNFTPNQIQGLPTP